MSHEDLIVNDGVCFGCGQQNDSGLRLTFRRTDEGVEAAYSVPEHFAGGTGVVHGGIQAALLDDVMGMTIKTARGETYEGFIGRTVTAEFTLRYRRPVPTQTPLVIKGRVSRIEEPNYYVLGEIIGPDGSVLTTAEARWRAIS